MFDRLIRPVCAAVLILSACRGSGDEASVAPAKAVTTTSPASAVARQSTKPPVAATSAVAATAPATGGEPPLVGLRNARRVAGYLVGGAMTADQVAEAKAGGYKRIIDLRMPDEAGVAQERAKAQELGIAYTPLPIAHANGLTQENILSFADLLADDAGPTIVHCASGNRVGAMFALRAFFIEKKPAQEALAFGKEAGLSSLEPNVRALLGL